MVADTHFQICSSKALRAEYNVYGNYGFGPDSHSLLEMCERHDAFLARLAQDPLAFVEPSMSVHYCLLQWLHEWAWLRRALLIQSWHCRRRQWPYGERPKPAARGPSRLTHRIQATSDSGTQAQGLESAVALMKCSIAMS
jgi:hypothetical protein